MRGEYPPEAIRAAIVGQPCRHTFTVTGSLAPTVTVTAGTLPDGPTLASGGVLSDIPTPAGVSAFTVTASNGAAPDAVLATAVTVADVESRTNPLLGSLDELFTGLAG